MCQEMRIASRVREVVLPVMLVHLAIVVVNYNLLDIAIDLVHILRQPWHPGSNGWLVARGLHLLVVLPNELACCPALQLASPNAWPTLCQR